MEMLGNEAFQKWQQDYIMLDIAFTHTNYFSYHQA